MDTNTIATLGTCGCSRDIPQVGQGTEPSRQEVGNSSPHSTGILGAWSSPLVPFRIADISGRATPQDILADQLLPK